VARGDGKRGRRGVAPTPVAHMTPLQKLRHEKRKNPGHRARNDFLRAT